jgi:hypothetical protein
MSKSINHQQYTTPKRRGSALPELVKATLLLDKVANSDFSCDEIARLPDREYNNYTIQSIRNRFNYLTTKRKNNPKQFWELYSDANKFAFPATYRDTVEEESDDEVTPPAQSRRQRTPDTTILSTPPPSSRNKKNMSGSARKKDPPSASSTFAYNTMFESLEEAQENGMRLMINLVLVHLRSFLFLTCFLIWCLHSRRYLSP